MRHNYKIKNAQGNLMKKICLFFCFLLSLLQSQDFYNLTQEIIQLNKQLQNPTSTKTLVELTQQKDKLMKQIAQSIAKKQFSSSTDLEKAISTLDNALSNSQQIQNPYSLALNTLQLNTLLAKKELLECIETLAKKNHFFTTHSQVNHQILRTIEKLKSFEQLPTNELSPTELKDFQSAQAGFSIVLESYIEILNFLNSNIGLFLPENFWSNFSFSWMLEQATALLPEQIRHTVIIKIIFSCCLFALAFFLRYPLAHLLLKFISTLSRFLKSQDIQEQIKEQVSTPILWIILLLSFNLSLDILSYPLPVSPKLKIWLNACFIICLSWLAILFFKGYGTAILGGLAQKNNSFRREVINLLLKVLYFLIVVIAILVLLKNFGFNISALIASLGIGGLAVAFAVKDMLANFFASVVLLFDNSFNQGDWIVCGDIEGTIVELGLRRTTIRTFDNAMLFVPNSLLANGSVKNWNRRKQGRRIRFQVGVAYSSTPEQIRACIRDIQLMLFKHPDIAKEGDERQPLSHYELDLKSSIVSLDDLLGYKSNLFVVLDEFAASSINILIYCFSKTTNWGEWLNVRQDVMLKIMDILDEHKLSFAFPSQSLYIEKMPEGFLQERV